MRLDEFLVKEGFAKSREKAKEMIKSSEVSVGGKYITKPAFNIDENEKIEVNTNRDKYVSRGGFKLEKALKCFDISLSGKVCADFGASTGGFTDCMLQNGAKKVYAVDVGHMQLDEKLRNNKNVCNIEGMNIRDISPDILGETVSFIGGDLSFISLRLVLKNIYSCLDEKGECVLLIKPQFECGKENVGKGGVVKSQKVHINVLENLINEFYNNKFYLSGLDYSPIAGGSGNIEYLAYLKKEKSEIKNFDLNKLTSEAFKGVDRK